MSRSVSSWSRTQVIARLRAAGCVFAEDEARLLTSAARTAADLQAMVDRRASGVPLEHVLGWADFCGLRITVDAGVFVPRRRTELLARQAALLVRPRAVVVDMCCGSGAVGAALTKSASIELHAVDLDPGAVRCARRNIAPAGGQAHVGDLFRPLPSSLRGRVDLVVANAPYVPTEAIALMPPEARLHEPRLALDGGPDGLGVQRRIAAQAPQWLAPGGHLLIETSEAQADRTADAVAESGLVPTVIRSRELGATVVLGAPASAPDVVGANR